MLDSFYLINLVDFTLCLHNVQTILGAWKHTSFILAGLFVRHQHSSNSYVASYAPLARVLMTNKNPAQILDGYLFPGALCRTS
ncbi:hypothetical protein BMETH_08_0 [methanotrophic bacterial endosymbiont of Bathymodiolus sp.]|nr:hypothetical protein BMETH_08_0 [methanotrophic bacterial endosymbiont of Bathymodiolus sp.]